MGLTSEMAKKAQPKKVKYNHYVAIIIDGKLSDWTGRNPERFPESKAEAMHKAEMYRGLGHVAYPVEIKEITVDDLA